MTYGNLIFPGASVVFCGLDRRQLGARSLPPNMYGVLIREFAPTLELALRLHPATEGVVVVSGTSDFDEELLAQAQADFRPYENRVLFTYLSELSRTNSCATFTVPSHNVVLFITMFQDSGGRPFVPRRR